jgi:hypothetical protein
MANLIDPSYFIRDIKIPNVYSPAVAENVNQFIAKYEPQCLRLLFGYDFYTLFQTEGITERMKDLLDGKGEWMGLVRPDIKDSLIAYYVYYFFEESMATQSTGVATSITQDASAMNVSPADKMVAAWNQFSYRVTAMYNFLALSKDVDGNKVYPELGLDVVYRGMEMFRPINYFSI